MVDVAEVLNRPYTRELIQQQPVAQLAYTAKDGSPRVIPIGYLLDGTTFLMWTVPGSAKTHALAADPRVAINVDTYGQPPRVLLARGRAELRTVDGAPDGYLQASFRTMPNEAHAGFEQGVRALYDQMVEIAVRLEWAKLLDFETTLPSAVEKLVAAKS